MGLEKKSPLGGPTLLKSRHCSQDEPKCVSRFDFISPMIVLSSLISFIILLEDTIDLCRMFAN